VNGLGDEVDDSLCANAGNATWAAQSVVMKPASVQKCDSGVVCSCATTGRCPFTNMVCGLDGMCRCGEGWVGSDCSTAQLKLSSSTRVSSCSGIVDVNHGCCNNVIDVVDGSCCGLRAVLDGHGRCCESGVVDACGECDGAGVAVDVLGVCCGSALPPSGVCCVSGVIDSCGVCDGADACAANVSANVVVVFPHGMPLFDACCSISWFSVIPNPVVFLLQALIPQNLIGRLRCLRSLVIVQ
jgi:hypothetical protein